MKKLCLLLVFLIALLPCTLKADIPIETLAHFAYSWLFEYDTTEYDLILHPYTVSDFNSEDPLPPLGEMGVVWDLNSDEIVNLQDFSILSQIDMTQFIEDMQFLKGLPQEYIEADPDGLEDYIQDLFNRIENTSRDLGIDIDNLKLFKILLYESDFEVEVYTYYYDIDDDIIYLDCILFWETETQYGYIEIWFEFRSYRYDYLYWYEYGDYPYSWKK